MQETLHAQAGRIQGQISERLAEGGEAALPPIQLAHYPVNDAALAACLATLGIAFRTPGPYTDDVELDAHGNERGRRMSWWLTDSGGGTSPETTHRTEEICAAWANRARFETDHPLHPLVAMRDALDARRYWVDASFGEASFGAARLPTSVPDGTPYFCTGSLHAAAVLKACGFRPLAFQGRGFYMDAMRDGVDARHIVASAAMTEGATPQQWMSRVLFNYSHLLKVAKSQSTIIRERFEDQTLLLTADSSRQCRDKFHALL